VHAAGRERAGEAVTRGHAVGAADEQAGDERAGGLDGTHAHTLTGRAREAKAAHFARAADRARDRGGAVAQRARGAELLGVSRFARRQQESEDEEKGHVPTVSIRRPRGKALPGVNRVPLT
jgi:hypothetical protein